MNKMFILSSEVKDVTESMKTKRDAIRQRINNLDINGENKFVLSNNEQKFEFKIITVCGDTYKVFGGFGYALRVFHKYQETEDIIEDFEQALKGMDLSIESCFFVSPYHFDA